MILQWKWKRHQYGSWKVQRVIGHTKSNVKSINMTLKSSKSCWSHQSKPPLKDPLACIHSHPLPNLSFTFLNYIDNPFIVFILLLSDFSQLSVHKSWWLLLPEKEPHLLLSPINPRSLMFSWVSEVKILVLVL